jgi:hypothetical protein
MPGARLLVPVIPLYAYLFALGLRGRRWRRVGVVYCGLAVAIPCVLMVAELPKARAAAAVRDRVATPFATWLGERYERVALVDVGYLARQGGFEAIDLGGLTDREFAHLPGGHLDKQISGRSLAAREPEALVLHSAVRPRLDEEGRITRLAGYPVEMRLAADPWVRRHFRCVERIEYHAGYFYAVLERRSD